MSFILARKEFSYYIMESITNNSNLEDNFYDIETRFEIYEP